MICAGMVFVEVSMQVPQRAMIGAVLGSAVETVFMSALVGFVDFSVEAVMFPMIACVLVIVVVRLVSRGGHHRCGQSQRCGRQYGFRHGHDRSPWLGLLGAANRERYGFRSERLRKALFIRGLRERRNLFAIVSLAWGNPGLAAAWLPTLELDNRDVVSREPLATPRHPGVIHLALHCLSLDDTLICFRSYALRLRLGQRPTCGALRKPEVADTSKSSPTRVLIMVVDLPLNDGFAARA